MKEETVLSDKDLKKEKYEFLNKLLDNCVIHEESGRFYCKRCQNSVRVDWHRNLAFCSNHIISRFGITYIEELYKIYG